MASIKELEAQIKKKKLESQLEKLGGTSAKKIERKVKTEMTDRYPELVRKEITELERKKTEHALKTEAARNGKGLFQRFTLTAKDAAYQLSTNRGLNQKKNYLKARDQIKYLEERNKVTNLQIEENKRAAALKEARKANEIKLDTNFLSSPKGHKSITHKDIFGY